MSDVNVRATAGNNQPVSHEAIRAIAVASFVADKKGDDIKGNAEQGLAYAIMLEYSALLAEGHKLPSLIDTLTSPEALKLVRDKMVAAFIGDAPNYDKLTNDQTSDAKSKRVARGQMITRAMRLAGVLAWGGVFASDYDKKTGRFTVLCKMLVGKGEHATAHGRLATLKTIPLDNGQITVDVPSKAKGSEPKARPFAASVRRIKDLCPLIQPRKPGGATAQDKKSDKAKTATVKITDFGDAQVLAQCVAIFCASDAPTRDTLDDYPKAVRNHLAQLAQWYHTMLAKQAAADKAKADAKANAKANKAAVATPVAA
jgi:hypothetical protein